MRKLAGIALISLIVTACGGGGSSTQPSNEKDQAAANAAVLQATDLPNGFSSSSSSSSSSNASDSQASDDADTCFKQATGVDPNAIDKNRTAKAKNSFKLGAGLDTVTVEGEVEMYREGSDLTAQLAALAQPGVTDCLKNLFATEFANRGATVGDLSIVPSKVEGVGDEQGGFTISGPITINNVSINFGTEVDFTRVGRVGLSATIVSLQGAPDHSLAVTAMTAMAGRLPK
jgi:hypothetical protein